MSTDNVGDSATAASEGINPDLTSTAGFEDLDEDRLPGGWTALKDRTTVTLSHTDAPHVEAI